MNKPKQEKQFLWDFIQEYVLGTGGFGSEEIIRDQQEKQAEEEGYDSAREKDISDRLGRLKSPDENYTSSNILKYPNAQTIGEQSDYVLFQFKKYSPPFQKPLTDGKNVFGDTSNGDTKRLNLTRDSDDRKVKSYFAKKFDYNQAEDYKDAGDDYPSIIMYMPEDISTGFRGNWGGKAFSTVGAGILTAAGQAGIGNKLGAGFGVVGGAAERALGLASAAVLQKGVQKAGGDSLTKDDIFGGISGAIMNPNTELMFQSVDMRNFALKFKLVPRNAGESKEINQIIKIFKACTLPERDPGQVMGFNDPGKDINSGVVAGFIGVPNLCRVSFMRGATEHKVLPRYKMLAVTEVDVNYTPDGTYATYRNDGQPVAIELTINFQETKINFAEEVLSGSVR
tara:strand:+ start:411 stop:1598 length:1188 start_codon:yes stop_codon:yes gene_type:complete